MRKVWEGLVAAMKKAYVATVEPIEDGFWLARVPEVQGCLSQGKSIAQARRRIQEALSLFDENAKVTQVKVLFPPDLITDIRHWKSIRDELTRLQKASNELLRRMLRRTAELRLSTRETADAFGLSFQRISQLAKEDAPRARYTRRHGHSQTRQLD